MTVASGRRACSWPGPGPPPRDASADPTERALGAVPRPKGPPPCSRPSLSPGDREGQSPCVVTRRGSVQRRAQQTRIGTPSSKGTSDPPQMLLWWQRVRQVAQDALPRAEWAHWPRDSVTPGPSVCPAAGRTRPCPTESPRLAPAVTALRSPCVGFLGGFLSSWTVGQLILSLTRHSRAPELP